MMENTIEERIGRYLSGEANEAEKAAFDQEMDTNPVLREQFLVFQRIWQNLPSDSKMEWDSDRAWNRLDIPEHKIPLRQTKTIRSLSLAVAATIILALGAAVLFWQNAKPVHYTYKEFQNKPIELADGSRIYLNENAAISVYKFQKRNRRVKLSGEAFFEVKEDLSKPFIVEAGGTFTEVVGTSFNINQSDENTIIYVSTGKVIFRSEKNENVALALTSGEAAIFEKNQLQRIPNPSPNINAWQTKQLTFAKEMMIEEIIADLSAFFKKEISIENHQIKNCRVTIPLSFKEPDMKNVLAAVTGTVNASFDLQDDKCIIRGGHCP